MGGFRGGHSGRSHTPFHHHHRHYYNFQISGDRSVDRSVKKIHQGKTYSIPSYGISKGSQLSFGGALSLSLVIIVLSLLVFLVLLKGQSVATVTSTYVSNADGITYEAYDFEYKVGDKIYTGRGDDDFEVMAGSIYSVVNVGQKYPIYYSHIIPS